jgi:hypothetical protein
MTWEVHFIDGVILVVSAPTRGDAKAAAKAQYRSMFRHKPPLIIGARRVG